MTRFGCLWILAALSLLPAIALGAEEPRIVALGDSTTAKRGELRIYAQVLSEKLKGQGRDVEIINAGVPGRNTSEATIWFHRHVLSKQPDVVVIQFGINDSAINVWKDPPATGPRVPKFIYEANLRHFVRMCHRIGARPILMTPNSLRWTPELKKLYGKPPYRPDDPQGFNITLRDYAAVVRRVAKEENAALVDVFAKFEQVGAENLLLDGMHPNESGHRLVTQLLLPEVIKALDHPAAKPVASPQPEGWTSDQGIWFEKRIEQLKIGSHSLGPFVMREDSAIVTAFHEGFYVSKDQGKTWGRHQISTPKNPVRLRPERALIQTRSGAMVLVFLNDAHHDTVKWGWDDKKNAPLPGTRRDVWVTRSLDGGKTWHEPQRLLKGYCGAIRDIVQMKSGRLVVPVQDLLMDEARHVTVVCTSDDDGATWKVGPTLDIGGRGHHDGSIEGTLVELRDGRLWMLLRTNLGYFLSTYSKDGLTWTPLLPTSINASSAPAMLSRLASGRLVMFWNRVYPEGETNYVRSGHLHAQRPASWHRGELSIAFSEDEGQTWTPPVVIARKRKAWLSYPYVCEVSPGVLWVTTMQTGLRMKIRESDFVGAE